MLPDTAWLRAKKFLATASHAHAAHATHALHHLGHVHTTHSAATHTRHATHAAHTAFVFIITTTATSTFLQLEPGLLFLLCELQDDCVLALLSLHLDTINLGKEPWHSKPSGLASKLDGEGDFLLARSESDLVISKRI